MSSPSPPKRAVTGVGARGGSRTGHRSGFGSGPFVAQKNHPSCTKRYTNREQEDVAKPRYSYPGVFDLAQMEISGDNFERAHQHTDKDWAATHQALSPQNHSPPSTMQSLAKRLQEKILDKSPKRSANQSKSSANDDDYIAAAAAASADVVSPTAYAESELSETISVFEDGDTEMSDGRHFSINQPLTKFSRHLPPQSSAASTRSAATTASTATTNSSSTATTSSSSIQSFFTMNRKHQIDHCDEEPFDQDDSEPSTQLEEPVLRFACHFHVHNPQKFNSGACATSSWDSMSRVKEHLYRCHTHVCLRCRRSFKNEKELSTHQVQLEACEIGIGAIEGITLDIKRQIKIRKKSSGDKSERGSWEAIYRLLFPGEDVPWPYFETAQQESLRSLDSRALTNIEEDLRQELPDCLRNSGDAQTLPPDVLERMISIINDRVGTVLARYGVDPLKTAINEPLTPPPGQSEQEKFAPHETQVLSHQQQVDDSTPYQIVSGQGLADDYSEQASRHQSMNIGSGGNDYSAYFNNRNTMLYPYQTPRHYSDGPLPYHPNLGASKVGISMTRTELNYEKDSSHEYGHNIAQVPQNLLKHPSKMPAGTTMEMLHWDHPHHLEVDSFMGGIDTGYGEANGFS